MGKNILGLPSSVCKHPKLVELLELEAGRLLHVVVTKNYPQRLKDLGVRIASALGELNKAIDEVVELTPIESANWLTGFGGVFATDFINASHKLAFEGLTDEQLRIFKDAHNLDNARLVTGAIGVRCWEVLQLKPVRKARPMMNKECEVVQSVRRYMKEYGINKETVEYTLTQIFAFAETEQPDERTMRNFKKRYVKYTQDAESFVQNYFEPDGK